MAKQIAISDEIYRELTKRKKNSSYSEVIKSLLKEEIKTSGQELMEVCKQMRETLTDEDIKDLEKSVKEFRKSFNDSFTKSIERMKKIEEE